MSLKDKLDKAFGDKKPKIVSIALERLHPPRKIVEGKGIDFSYLANNSSFQRGVMEFIKKYVPGLETINPRANKEEMKRIFNENANNYRKVMNELKTVLELRKRYES